MFEGSSKHIRERLVRCRTAMLLDQPFYGFLAMRLQLVEDRGCKSAWVNGVTLGYNPDFIESLTDPEVKTILAHEVMHVAECHCWRRDDREVDPWNDACDYVVNQYLVNANEQLPRGALLDGAFKGLPAEAVYAKLPKPPPHGSSG